jgi:hypothetical protein
VAKFFSETAQPSLLNLYVRKPGSMIPVNVPSLHINLDMFSTYSSKDLDFFLDQLGVDLDDYKKRSGWYDDTFTSPEEIRSSCLFDFCNPHPGTIYKFNAKRRITMSYTKRSKDYTCCIVYFRDTFLYTSHHTESGKLSEFWNIDGQHDVSADYTTNRDLPYSIVREDGKSKLCMDSEGPSTYYLIVNGSYNEVSFVQFIDYQLQRATVICDGIGLLATKYEEIITLILQYCG